VTIEEINACDERTFVAAVGSVFEHSPWVAERTWRRRPFPSLDALHARMVDTMHAATRAEQLALLRAHPDLGARMRMSDASTGEQSGAGLDSLRGPQFEELQRLNRAYRERFGFPFLLAVKGSTPAQVLGSLVERLPRGADDEFAEALRQVARIARFRLETIIQSD
jgi:2-oxo-4-hydroxy-4-carboxy-5-ureidoimidazoline decarboxylase